MLIHCRTRVVFNQGVGAGAPEQPNFARAGDGAGAHI